VAKRLLVNFILLLCIGVMNRELPECMALRDDVWNDGDVAVYNLRVPQCASVRAGMLEPRAASASRKVSSPLLLLTRRTSHLPAPVLYSGAGLLRLIDRQRC
jgi:hypothetical protein